MDSIFLKNKKFIKASVIAKELGYTSDYIGQLCRGGKVEAELVGRTWYVADEAIREHKKNRYRSTAKTTKRSLEKMVLTEPLKDTPIVGYKVRLSYESDQAELIPQPKKKKQKDEAEIEVDQLEVVSDEKSHTVRLKDLTREPKTGSLQINIATEEPLVEPEPIKIASPTPTPVLVEKKPDVQAPALKETPLPKPPVRFTPASVATPSASSALSRRSGISILLTGIVVALVLATGLNLVSSKTTYVVGSDVTKEYKFDVENINNIISALKNNVFSS